MDKIAKVPHLREALDWLDQTYGVEKEGFFHQEHWQLLVAIMLSAQSTDKQVLDLRLQEVQLLCTEVRLRFTVSREKEQHLQ